MSSGDGGLPPIAVTGASGFVGRHVVAGLKEAGQRARIFLRKGSTAPPETETVIGDLGDLPALERLCAGTAAVIHCAGAISATSPAGFTAANVQGTANLLRSLPAAARLVHVSSLAAREPRLSAYGASKRAAEGLVAGAAGLDSIVVRPPAVYGPGDRATLPIFRDLARGRLIMPADARSRFSLIYVEDLAKLLVRLALGAGVAQRMIEPDDGRSGGYGWADLADIASNSLGRRVSYWRIAPPVLWPVAALAGLWSRLADRPTMLTLGKLRELAHADWIARGFEGVSGWRPEVQFPAGFEATVAWYRRAGWL